MDEALIREIRNVFPEGTVPGRPVTAHRCRECAEVDRLIGGRPWPEVAASFPDYCCDAFPLLTEQAQVYYLPAYLELVVGEPGNIAGSSLQLAFERRRLPREAFTAAQRTVILRWLKMCYGDDPVIQPPEGLLAYWQDY